MGDLEKKNCTNNETKSNSKPLAVWFIGESASFGVIKPDNRLIEKTRSTKIPTNHKKPKKISGLANSYGGMNPNFDINILPL